MYVSGKPVLSSDFRAANDSSITNDVERPAGRRDICRVVIDLPSKTESKLNCSRHPFPDYFQDWTPCNMSLVEVPSTSISLYIVVRVLNINLFLPVPSFWVMKPHVYEKCFCTVDRQWNVAGVSLSRFRICPIARST